MQNRTTILFPLILMGFMALITFWINKAVEQQMPRIDGSERHDPDYTMENFVTKQTDEDGNLNHVLDAVKMTHYPDDDSTVLEKPKFTQYAEDKPYTKIDGDHGNVSSDGEEIEIIDNVVIVREAYDDKGEMRVLTDQIMLFIDLELAKTDRPVTIYKHLKPSSTGREWFMIRMLKHSSYFIKSKHTMKDQTNDDWYHHPAPS